MAQRPDLTAYLAQVAAKPFERVHADCVAMCVDWAEMILDRKVWPYVPKCFRYDDASVFATLAGQGGMKSAARRIFKCVGLPEVSAPWQVGDIGVIDEIAMAIRTESGWVTRSHGGLSRIRDGHIRIAFGLR